MIIVKLMGGLGNQMFQYAAAKSLSLLTKSELKFDLTWFSSSEHCTFREFQLGIFENIEIPSASINEISKYTNSLKNNKILRKIINRKNVKCYHEIGFNFNYEFFDLNNDVYLDGYWQSEKYFNVYETIIRNDFKFCGNFCQKNEEIFEKICNKNSVSIHIRRGDYVGNIMHGGVCDLNYYNKAVKIMSESLSKPEFFYFSDDIKWVEESVKNDFPVHFIDWNNENNSFRDMQLMSFCKHNIIANSSFSWWGAWLNNNPYKIVIAPERWFNDESIDTSDLLPKVWIKI